MNRETNYMPLILSTALAGMVLLGTKMLAIDDLMSKMINEREVLSKPSITSPSKTLDVFNENQSNNKDNYCSYQ